MLKSISHIILAMFFLASTAGTSINMHFCKDKLYDIGFFTHADNCCNDNTHHHNQCNSEKKQNHCKDESIQLKVKDDFTVTSTDFDHFSVHVISLFLYSSTLFDFSSKLHIDEIILSQDISPPKILTKLSFLQTYLL